MYTHNLYFEQKLETVKIFLLKFFNLYNLRRQIYVLQGCVFIINDNKSSYHSDDWKQQCLSGDSGQSELG